MAYAGEPASRRDDVLDVLLSMTDEAVITFDEHGTILTANGCAARFLGVAADAMRGTDVKDFFYDHDLTRPRAGLLPFDVSGQDNLVMAKLVDGSFVPTLARCRRIARGGAFLLIAEDVDDLHENRREQTRLFDELRRSNDRLRGVLSIISTATLSQGSFEEFSEHVTGDLQSVFDADAVLLYLVEPGGFRLWGHSEGYARLGVDQGFLPLGTGVPSLVTRARRSMRLQLVQQPVAGEGAVMVDLDTDVRTRVRSTLAGVCSTLAGTPVFSYDRVMAVIVVCWKSPHVVESGDLSLLDTVGDFLSVEFSAAVSQLQQMRERDLAELSSEVRDAVRTAGVMNQSFAEAIGQRVTQLVPAHVISFTESPRTGQVVARVLEPLGGEEGEGDAAEAPLPGEPDTRLAAHVNPGGAGGQVIGFPFPFEELLPGDATSEAVDPASPFGAWVERHTDQHYGVVVRVTSPNASDDVEQRALVFLRSRDDPPFDDTETSFLARLGSDLAHALDVEVERASASRISQALQSGLRNELPPAPGVTCASLYLSATASAVVGGDFFDLYPLPGDRAVIVVGDVSGKGVEAASIASLLKTALAAYAWEDLDPAAMLASLNNLFVNFSRLETFASMVVVSVDVRRHVATYCSGGHPPAMLVRSPHGERAELELLTVQSPLVGAMEDMEYVNGTFAYDVGDLLFLYTDGTTEARSPSGDFFGEDALRETLLRASALPVEQVPERVLSEVTSFTGGSLHDDVAMVAVRFDALDAPAAHGAPTTNGAPAINDAPGAHGVPAAHDGPATHGEPAAHDTPASRGDGGREGAMR